MCNSPRLTTPLVLAAALLAAAPARATVVDATVTTLLAGRQDPRDGRVYSVVPAYEMLQLRLDDVHTRYVDVRVVLSAWGEVAFGEPRDGRATGDVDIGYIETAVFSRRATFRAGRQLIFAGGARVFQLDGGSARLRLFERLFVDVFGGAPVTPRFAVKLGDAVVGGRLSWRESINTEGGLSYLHVLDGGRVAREDLGADLRYTPVRALALSGYLLYAVSERRIGEIDVGATWQPHATVDVRVDYRRTAPDLFLPRSSILSVFASETRDETGATLFARPVARLSLSADYHVVFEEAGVGHRAGGRAALRLSRGFQTLAGVEARALRLPDNGYTQVRLFATHRLSPSLLVALDLDAYALERAINGITLSLTGSATVAWDFARGWRAVVTGLADTTPLIERRFEVIARLVYNHQWRFRRVTP
jgi:hypothetical protein